MRKSPILASDRDVKVTSSLSDSLPNQQPLALPFVQLELLHCGKLGRLGVGRLDKSEEMRAAADNRHAPCAGLFGRDFDTRTQRHIRRIIRPALESRLANAEINQ